MVGLDVVIRVHDAGRLDELERAVFAASCQEYRPLALVVVCQRFDAGALAAVRAALGPILAIVPEVGFTLLNHEGGPADARAALLNVGIVAGRGRYLAFLDYDDVIYPEGWRLLIEELGASEAAIAFGGVLNAEVMRAGVVPVVVGKRRVFAGEGLGRLLRGNFCPLHSFVVDRERVGAGVLVVDAGLTVLEDYELLLRICAGHVSSFRLIDRIVGEYLFKDDGSQVNPLAVLADPGGAWAAAEAGIAARKAGMVLAPAVQASLGVDEPGLTVADYVARGMGLAGSVGQ